MIDIIRDDILRSIYRTIHLSIWLLIFTTTVTKIFKNWKNVTHKWHRKDFEKVESMFLLWRASCCIVLKYLWHQVGVWGVLMGSLKLALAWLSCFGELGGWGIRRCGTSTAVILLRMVGRLLRELDTGGQAFLLSLLVVLLLRKLGVWREVSLWFVAEFILVARG